MVMKECVRKVWRTFKKWAHTSYRRVLKFPYLILQLRAIVQYSSSWDNEYFLLSLFTQPVCTVLLTKIRRSLFTKSKNKSKKIYSPMVLVVDLFAWSSGIMNWKLKLVSEISVRNEHFVFFTTLVQDFVLLSSIEFFMQMGSHPIGRNYSRTLPVSGIGVGSQGRILIRPLFPYYFSLYRTCVMYSSKNYRSINSMEMNFF